MIVCQVVWLNDVHAGVRRRGQRIAVWHPLPVLTNALRAVVSIAATPARKVLGILTPPRPTGPDRGPQDAAAGPGPEGRGGKYDDALLRIAAEQPGVTVAQAAERIGVPATALYPPIRRLEAQERIVKRGRGLHPT